jgi:hypothetical protein
MAWNDKEFVPAWLRDKFDEADPFHKLVLDLALEVETRADLLDALVAAVSLPDIPPDVTEVRIMSLHKSKGLSSPVVIIAGCVEGLLPTAPDEDLPPADRDAKIEEERRLFFVGLTLVKAEPGHGKPGVQVVTSSRTMSLADAKQSGIRPARVVYGTVHLHASRFISRAWPCSPSYRARLSQRSRWPMSAPFDSAHSSPMRTRTLWMRGAAHCVSLAATQKSGFWSISSLARWKRPLAPCNHQTRARQHIEGM